MIHNLFCPIQPTIPGDGDLAVSNIKRCVHEIDRWMLVNRLKVNKDETVLLVISAKHLPRPRTLCRQWDHPLLSESDKYRCHFWQSVSFQRTYRKYLKIIYNISYIRKYLSTCHPTLLKYLFMLLFLRNWIIAIQSLLYGTKER